MSSSPSNAVALDGDGDGMAPKDSGVRLPLHICIGWGIGSAGMATLLNVTNGLILKYVVDFLGMTAVVAGSLVAATRIFDAAIDPLMGMLSDKTTSRWGRRRPYLLVGSFLCALTPIVIFVLPQQTDVFPTTALVVLGLLFYAVSYTTYNVPYMAMPVEMTQNHHERTYLFSFRIYGIAIGGLMGGALAPWLVTQFGEDADAFGKMAYTISAIILGGCLTCFFLTRNAPILRFDKSAARPGIGEIKLVLHNRPFLLLLFAKVFIVAGTGVGAASLAFFVTRVLREPLSWLGFFVGLSTVGLIVSQPMWVAVAKRYGKRVCFLFAAACYIVVVLTWLLAGPGEGQFAVGLRALLLGVFGGGILLSTQSMLPDVLEHEVALTGIRHEGVMTGLYTTVERGSSAIGVALAGLILSVGGYVGGAELITPDAIRAIYICVAIMPALMMAVSIAAMSRYDLPG